ncbi:MAG: hypothetical protein M3Z17_04365 [Gemmatimonadota bacterium]|nr:hypothetical protein [Gemmatimonadota bacterium]
MFEATNEKRDDEFFEWCRKVGDGNPFFLHELVKQWLETKQRHTIPPSLMTVIRERFSRLSTDGTQLLQACSVLGEQSTLPRVEMMLHQEPYMLLAALSELSKASMLSPERKITSASGDFHLRPRHDLVSTVALKELDPHATAFLHRRAAEVLEAELGGEIQDTALLWACAKHWKKAGNEPEYMRRATQSAQQMIKVGLPQEAAEKYCEIRQNCSNQEDSNLLLDKELFALQAANNWRAVYATLLPQYGADVSSDTHDHRELMYLLAMWRCIVDNDQIISRTLACIGASNSDPGHRLRAAAIGIKAASDLGNTPLMDEIFRPIADLLNGPLGSTVDAQEVALVYHCVREDGSRVYELANNLALAARVLDDPVRMGSALSNAAFANLLSGHTSEALALLTEAYDRMMELKLRARAWHFGLEIVRVLLDLEDAAGARKWFDKFDNFNMICDNRGEFIRVSWVALKLALAEGDLVEAEKRLKSTLSMSETEQTLQWKCAMAALEVRFHVLRNDGDQLLRSAVERLGSYHDHFRETGRHDYEAYSLYLGWRHLGDTNRARDVLATYLKRRREVSPVPVHIKAALAAHNEPLT